VSADSTRIFRRSRVRERFPRLEITLTATSSVRAADDLRHGRLDIVIQSVYGVAAASCEPGLRQWVLGHDALRLCVPDGHHLSRQASCAITDLRDEKWVMSPSSPLGRLSMGLFATAGFQPSISATVDDVGSALGLVSVGWGVTIAPDLTPAGADANITRIAIQGLEAFRHSVLVVRDGEQDAPQIATVVSAVHVASSNLAYMP
jgi:DNA-binding transcriptional LysR family regulator